MGLLTFVKYGVVNMKEYILCRRVSGFGDMLSQFAHCLALSEKLELPLYVDWRNVLYSDESSPSINLFSSSVFCRNVYPVEDLFPYLEEKEKSMVRSGHYVGNVSGKSVLDALEDDGGERDYLLSISGRGLIVTQAVPRRSESLLYDALQDVYFHDKFYEYAEEVTSRLGERFNAIHYRHGNGEFSDVKGYEDHVLEIQRILHLYKKTEKDLDKPVYVSTDSLEARRIFQSEFSGIPNIAFSGSLPEKLSGGIHFSGVVESEKDTSMFDVFRSTVVDMLIMAGADTIFRDSRSSFANYSCAVARKNNDFLEVKYSSKRVKASMLASHEVMKKARSIVSDRNNAGDDNE
jgi:hypothetical protein